MARQYVDTFEDLTDALVNDLLVHMLLPKLGGPRTITVSRLTRAALVVYSDASYGPEEEHPAKLDLIVFSDRRPKRLGLAAILPETEMLCLKNRKQQITPCEMLPVLYFPSTHPELVAHSDVLMTKQPRAH